MNIDIPEIKERQDLVRKLEKKEISEQKYSLENDRLIKIINKKTKDYKQHIVVQKEKIEEDIEKKIKSNNQIYKVVREIYKLAQELFSTIQKFKQEVYTEFFAK